MDIGRVVWMVFLAIVLKWRNWQLLVFTLRIFFEVQLKPWFQRAEFMSYLN